MINIDGEDVSICSARDAIDNGISLVPEDRKLLGLVLGQSILKNISLPNMDRFTGRFSVNQHKEYYECDKMSKRLSVKSPSVHAIVESLSGGNQQKVVLAKMHNVKSQNTYPGRTDPRYRCGSQV